MPLNTKKVDAIWTKITSGEDISSEQRESFLSAEPEYIVKKVKENLSSVNNWFVLAENKEETLVALCTSYAMFIGLEKDRTFSEKEALTMVIEWLDFPYSMLILSFYSKKFPISVLLEKQTYDLLNEKIKEEGVSSKALERKNHLDRVATAILGSREADVADYLRSKLTLIHGEEIKNMPDKWILKAFGAYSS